MKAIILSSIAAASLVAACGSTGADTTDNAAGDLPSNAMIGDAAGTRPAGEMTEVVVEGRISDGVECPIVTTPDGTVYSLSLEEADFGPGDYVRITGEIADASLCMQGQGHLLPTRIDEIEPPARDRDPARAGGVALTLDYLVGPWTAKGIEADCDKPDFDVSENSREMAIVETRVNNVPSTGVITIGPTPRMIFDKPLPELPVETRGPDGLAVMPASDGRGLTLAGHRIAGDGVVFIKCPDPAE